MAIDHNSEKLAEPLLHSGSEKKSKSHSPPLEDGGDDSLEAVAGGPDLDLTEPVRAPFVKRTFYTDIVRTYARVSIFTDTHFFHKLEVLDRRLYRDLDFRSNNKRANVLFIKKHRQQLSLLSHLICDKVILLGVQGSWKSAFIVEAKRQVSFASECFLPLAYHPQCTVRYMRS